MITEIEGDVFKSKDDILIHGCNVFCKMGAGVARTVKKIYPLAYAADKKTGEGDPSKLGNYTYSIQNHIYYPQNIIVINLYTQYYYSKKMCQFDYDSFSIGLKVILKNFKNKSISMPRIGSGLAGGDWKKIKAIINDVFKKRKITVYYLKEGN